MRLGIQSLHQLRQLRCGMHLYAHKESTESPKEQVVEVLFSLVDGMLSLISASRIDELESRLLHIETLLQETRSSISDAKKSVALQDESNPSLRKHTRSRTLPTSSASTVSGAASDSRFNPTHSKFSTEANSYLQQTVRSSLASDDESYVAGLGLHVLKKGHTRLPKKDEALVLLKEFLEGFNNILPLFHPKVLLQSFERNYTRDQPKDSAWWAVLNVLLALSIRMNTNRKELGEKASKYAQNAFSVIPDLTMQQTDLAAIQALLGMAIFLQGTPNPQPASILTAAAIRLSYGLGMHRNDFGVGLPPIEAQQRQRVFWVAYCLDKDFSLRFEQPPIINDNDMNVHLPETDPRDGLGLMHTTSNGSAVNYFRLRIHLAVIQSKTYTDLYSVRALQLSEEKRLPAVQKLDELLEQWKANLPAELQPDNLAAFVGPFSVTHVVILHLMYFNCLATVHRVSFFQNRLWARSIMGENGENGEDSGRVPHQLCVSAIRCNEAARASLHLMNLVPQGDFACTWYATHLRSQSYADRFEQDPLFALCVCNCDNTSSNYPHAHLWLSPFRYGPRSPQASASKLSCWKEEHRRGSEDE
jgi:hypothetical protein